MKILLALVAALGWALLGTAVAEQPSRQPLVLAALGSTCTSEAAASTALGASRHDAGALQDRADVERLQEYLSFHSDALHDHGIVEFLPSQDLRATAN